jgi:RNA polymerase sigma factor (TIGR02999 family)
MMVPSREPTLNSSELTQLLQAWHRGDVAASEKLLPVIYAELHRQAARAMRRESETHTLQPTALVNEAYLRLVDQDRVEWQSRAHFFGVAAQMMRRILVDHARGHRAVKRGAGMPRMSLDGSEAAGDLAAHGDDASVLDLHDALERLAVLDPLQARLVELRYFGGLTIEETAAALDRSPATIKREWAIARAWLRRELGSA